MKFEDLNLNKPILNALSDLGYTTPTTIQHKSFSVMMSGRDVVGIAQTGTGKTLAYLLPILRQYEFTKQKVVKVLILVPTRELVVQVVESAKKLAAYMSISVEGVYGGTNIKTQMAMINQTGLDVLVATPGRLLDLNMNGTVQLKNIKKLVIDEVDEMLSLGFRYQLTTILNLLPQKKQTMMFSATITPDIEALINEYFNNPVKVEAAPTGTPLDKIDQSVYNAPNFYTKVNLLKHLLADKEQFKKVLVFAPTIARADDLYEAIESTFAGNIGIIHSNKSQNNRFDTVKKFGTGEYRALIATDIIARGLDIAEVSHVINFDTPDEAENYIHRIGRTGRADKNGTAITFTSPAEEEHLAAIEKLMNRQVTVVPLPEEVEVVEQLAPWEDVKFETRNIFDKMHARLPEGGGAYHERAEHNQKVNMHLRRSEKLKLKYGKPKTKGGQKGKKKK